jgi:hypothetical protein
LVPILISLAPGAAVARDDTEVWKSHAEELFGRYLTSQDKLRKVRQVIFQNMERSYISIGSGGRYDDDASPDNLLYEAQVFHNFSWVDKDLVGLHYWFDVPIRLGVRQFDEDSKPVKTPTYNPGVRVYLWSRDDEPGPLNSMFYFSLGAHHYSNGQSGEPLLDDGTVNTQTGSFSTNYLEFAVHYASGDGRVVNVIGPVPTPSWYRLTYRDHVANQQDAAQHRQYETRSLSFAYRPEPIPMAFGTRSVVTFTAARSDRQYVVYNVKQPELNKRADWNDNTQLTVEWMLVLRTWKDLGFYLRYDNGYDYYNINFQQPMNRLQLGFAATNF